MGQTQHTNRHCKRSRQLYPVLALAISATSGAGANPFRGHDNVQGASDRGSIHGSLPLLLRPYRGSLEALVTESGRAEFEFPSDRFDNPKMMNTAGIPATRWFDATMLPKDQVEQKGQTFKAMVVIRA